MNSKSSRASVYGLLAMLVTTFFLVGCQQTLPIRTAAIDGQVAVGVCEAWQPVTYSSRDTEETQLEARANNAARTAYCE